MSQAAGILLLGLGSLLAGCRPARPAAADPLLTIDHLFVLVPPGAQRAQAALQQAGFTVNTSVNRHDGGGTASITVRFDNAYLELLWVDSTVPLDSAWGPRAERYRRAVPGRPTDPSPFGVGLRRLPSAPEALPWVTRPYHALWMEPDEQIDVLAPAADFMPAPRVFVVPRSMAFDAWSAEEVQDHPAHFRHPIGAHRLTSVELHLPPIAAALPPGRPGQIEGLRLVPDTTHLAILTLDDGATGRSVDLRPAMPLLIRY